MLYEKILIIFGALYWVIGLIWIYKQVCKMEKENDNIN